jgi:hypothetical protein
MRQCTLPKKRSTDEVEKNRTKSTFRILSTLNGPMCSKQTTGIKKILWKKGSEDNLLARVNLSVKARLNKI